MSDAREDLDRMTNDLGIAVAALDRLREAIVENDLEHGLEEELASAEVAIDVFRSISKAERVAMKVVGEGRRYDGVPTYMVECSKKLPPVSGAFVVPVKPRLHHA